MSLRLITVHVDETPAATIRAEIAAELAVAHGARVEGLIVASTPGVVYGPGAAAFGDAFQTMRMSIALRNREAAEAAARGLETVHKMKSVIVDTSADRIVLDLASRLRPSDLAILPAPRENGVQGDEDVFEAAVFAAGRPALIVPPTRDASPVGRNIVIAWKDCREAARAVHDAMPLLEKAQSVRFAVVHSDEDKRYFGLPALERMEAALKARGVPLGEPLIEGAHGKSEIVLLRLATQARADMLVMGAYGRWRVSEILFGGFTQHVLAHADIPVFLSH